MGYFAALAINCKLQKGRRLSCDTLSLLIELIGRYWAYLSGDNHVWGEPVPLHRSINKALTVACLGYVRRSL